MDKSSRSSFATILIVEDEALVRLELAVWLAEIGVDTLSAETADDAIALLDSHPEIEGLLTDIKLPGSMDGIRLAHHVRGRWPPVRIIVISGFIDTLQADLPQGSLFIPKPFGPEKLRGALAHLAPGGQPGAPSRRAA